jgi:hypothetical protein
LAECKGGVPENAVDEQCVSAKPEESVGITNFSIQNHVVATLCDSFAFATKAAFVCRVGKRRCRAQCGLMSLESR